MELLLRHTGWLAGSLSADTRAVGETVEDSHKQKWLLEVRLMQVVVCVWGGGGVVVKLIWNMQLHGCPHAASLVCVCSCCVCVCWGLVAACFPKLVRCCLMRNQGVQKLNTAMLWPAGPAECRMRCACVRVC